ncbi:hypothetical protein AAK967_06990 [Atopobiaceae bacterium 24-176]
MAKERFEASAEPCFLVGEAASRRMLTGAAVRLWGASVPAGALAMVEGSDGGLLCPTPAFHLMLRAADLDRVSLLRLAQEFWGTYDTRPDLPSGIAARPAPLCTRDALRDMAAAVGERYPGKARVEWVIEQGVDGAASPPEGALGAFFSLGRRWGGVGAGPVLLNEPVELSDRGRRIVGVGRLRPDILFPDGRLALEYDSEAHHGTAEARARDSERKLALEASGITVFSIGPSVLSSQRRLAALADAVVERLTGRGEKPLGPGLVEARRRLLTGLLSKEPLF